MQYTVNPYPKYTNSSVITAFNSLLTKYTLSQYSTLTQIHSHKGLLGLDPQAMILSYLYQYVGIPNANPKQPKVSPN